MTLEEQTIIQENMRGIILAGGRGTRLLPLTKVTNKHLIPVADKPMINYPLETLTSIGIKDICVVTGIEHAGAVFTYLGSGQEYGINFTYKIQDEAKGIAQALSLTQDFAQQKKIAVILADNIFLYNFKQEATEFITKNYGAMLFLKEVDNPQRFGVATIDPHQKKILKIEEKPEHPQSKLAVTGLYFYDTTVYNKIKPLKPSKRGELEITDVNNAYVNEQKITYNTILNWFDAGTHETREMAEEHIRKHNNTKK